MSTSRATPPEERSTTDRLSALAVRLLPAHAWVFVLANLGLTGLNIAGGAPWWALWPLLIWGAPFSIHYFLYKSMTVDERWADERIDDLRFRAYDMGHMEDLEDRILIDDQSTRPTHRRDPDWWREPPHGQDKGESTGAEQRSSDDKPSKQS